MVRKIISVVVCTLLLLGAAAATASAVNVYEGTMSSSVTAYVRDIHFATESDYVYYRSGQYTYDVLVGDLEYSNGTFTLVGDSGLLYRITTSTSSASYTTYSVSEVSSYSVSNPHNILIYSNLGHYPALNDSTDVYSYICVVLLIVFGICSVLRSLFSWVLRIH